MKRKPPAAIDEDWMSTYGDMVTLLLCFFVMMAGVSKIDAALFEQIQAGMNEGVGKRDVQRPIEMMLVELTDDIQSLSVGNEVSLGTDSQGVVLEFDGDFMFDYGSAKLREPVIPVLKKVAATLNTERYNSFNFEISGHTSDHRSAVRNIPRIGVVVSAGGGGGRFFESRGIPRIRLRAVGLYDVAPKYPNRDRDDVPIPQNRAKTAGWKSILCHHLSKFEKARFGGFFSVKANGVCGRKSRGGRVFSVGRDCDI